MAHDPTRAWPLGIGPDQTAIPGAAWLELLDGQAFPVVGAGTMVWNGTMWVPVSTQNRLPVDAAVSDTVDVSDRADRQLGKVALTDSDVDAVETLVALSNTTVTAGATRELLIGGDISAFRYRWIRVTVRLNPGAWILRTDFRPLLSSSSYVQRNDEDLNDGGTYEYAVVGDWIRVSLINNSATDLNIIQASIVGVR